MKIIKIVHTRPQGEAEAEPQRILAYGYDIDTFVERNRESIFQAVHAQKHLPQVTWNDVGSLVRGATALGTVYQRYHDTLMKFTVEHFLRDLRDQLTHLEVISLEIAKEKYSRSTNLPIGTYT